MSVAEELRKHAGLCRDAANHMQYRFMATSLLEEAEECERIAAAEDANRGAGSAAPHPYC